MHSNKTEIDIIQAPDGSAGSVFFPWSFIDVNGTADADAILAAIAAAQADYSGGLIIIDRPYRLLKQVTIPSGPPVTFMFTGSINRQVTPNQFSGGVILPASTFPASTALFSIGTAGSPNTNPCGMTFIHPQFSGTSADGTVITGCTGLLITDTADVHLIEPGFANFDRTGATGTAISLASTGAGNGVGFQVYGGIISNCFQGIFGDGAGVTDMRIIGLLDHSNTQFLNLGPTAGGGGLQMTGCHLVFAGAASGAYRISLGSQAGDYTIVGNYIDKNGVSPAILLANAKGVIADNHFIADAAATGALVTLSTASQEMQFRGNHCNGAGSGMTALFKTTAHAGAPTCGVYDGNIVYGSPGSLISVLIDSANTAFPATGTATTYVQGNVSGA